MGCQSRQFITGNRPTGHAFKQYNVEMAVRRLAWNMKKNDADMRNFRGYGLVET
jgi:hypothetical protein